MQKTRRTVFLRCFKTQACLHPPPTSAKPLPHTLRAPGHLQVLGESQTLYSPCPAPESLVGRRVSMTVITVAAAV